MLRISPEKSRETDYVREEVAIGLLDRLMDIKRRYRHILDLGSGPGALARDLEDYGGLEKLTMTDSSSKSPACPSSRNQISPKQHTHSVCSKLPHV